MTRQIHIAQQPWLTLVIVLAALAPGAAFGQTTSTFVPRVEPSTSSNWHEEARWDNAHIPNAVGDVAIFNHPIDGGAAGTGNFVLSLGGQETTVGSIISNNAANNYHFNINNGTLIFQTASGPATYSENLGTGTPTAPAAAIGANLRLMSDLVFTQAHALSLNSGFIISGRIDGGAERTFTKEGGGNLQFNYNSPFLEGEGFFGEFIINNGAIRLIQSQSISVSKGMTVNAGGQLQIGNQVAETSLGPGAVLRLNGIGKASGANSEGAVRFAVTTGVTSNFNSQIVLETDSRITVSANATGVLTAPISGPGGLVKTGAGTLKLTAANTFTNNTKISAGAMILEGASASLGTGMVTVDGVNAGTSLLILSGVLNAIPDTTTLALVGGGVAGLADQGYVDLGAGVNEIVGGLVLGGNVYGPGVYGSTASSAPVENQFDEFFFGSGLITVVAPPDFAAADFNNDGFVNAADFEIWKGGFGNATGQTKADGDANGDQAVNGADFLVWQEQFGLPVAVAAGTVPEPSAVLLAFVAGLAGTRIRRCR